MKTGGRLIYAGPLGKHSSRVIEYFEVRSLLISYPTSFPFLHKCLIAKSWFAFLNLVIKSIPGVQKIKDNYNPSTWMLEVTSRSAESELGIDFAQIYRESTLYE